MDCVTQCNKSAHAQLSVSTAVRVHNGRARTHTRARRGCPKQGGPRAAGRVARAAGRLVASCCGVLRFAAARGGVLGGVKMPTGKRLGNDSETTRKCHEAVARRAGARAGERPSASEDRKAKSASYCGLLRFVYERPSASEDRALLIAAGDAPALDAKGGMGCTVGRAREAVLRMRRRHGTRRLLRRGEMRLIAPKDRRLRRLSTPAEIQRVQLAY